MSPQCANYVDLEFSIHAFEHLEVSLIVFLISLQFCYNILLVLVVTGEIN